MFDSLHEVQTVENGLAAFDLWHEFADAHLAFSDLVDFIQLSNVQQWFFSVLPIIQLPLQPLEILLCSTLFGRPINETLVSSVV